METEKRKRGRPRKHKEDESRIKEIEKKLSKASDEELDLFSIPPSKLTFKKMVEQLYVLYPNDIKLINEYVPTVRCHRHLSVEEKRFVLEYLIQPSKIDYSKFKINKDPLSIVEEKV